MSEQQGQEKREREFVPDVTIDPETGRETEQHRDKMETQKGADKGDAKGDKATERQ